MESQKQIAEIPSLSGIDREAGHIGRQLAQALRAAIVRGELKQGERLPSTRSLATTLGLARGTVTEAYDQLIAEGYLEAILGSGTRVVQLLEHSEFIGTSDNIAPTNEDPLILPARVAQYEKVAQDLAPLPSVPFSIAVPMGDVAPDDNWRRLSNRVRAGTPASPSSYADPKGLYELRKEIAEYARKSRAVICHPEQVIITAGTQQGLYLAGRVLLSPGDSVWAENPAYPGLLAVLRDQNLNITQIPVDQLGLDVSKAFAMAPNAKAAFVTPSHQYPLGMPMSMTRRMDLLAWTKEHGGWIVEDDYDSEMRYAGHPFPSMQGLYPLRVIYLGTFSKVLFPSLRIGYAIVPEPLADAFAGARALVDRHSPTADQHVLATFMQEGYFETHIRRIRSIYADRRKTLIDAIQRELSPWAFLQPCDQGMHLIIWLPEGIDDVKVATMARAAGVAVRAISPMYAYAPRSGLMLGFGGFTPNQLNQAVLQLKDVMCDESKLLSQATGRKQALS